MDIGMPKFVANNVSEIAKFLIVHFDLSIIANNNSSIGVKSQINKGTTFTITFPKAF